MSYKWGIRHPNRNRRGKRKYSKIVIETNGETCPFVIMSRTDGGFNLQDQTNLVGVVNVKEFPKEYAILERKEHFRFVDIAKDCKDDEAYNLLIEIIKNKIDGQSKERE